MNRLTAKQRYRQALAKAKITARRSLQAFIDGREPFAKCGLDLERDCLIAEIERAYRIGYADGANAHAREARAA